jgi:monothiol glutaredoxin
MAINQFIDNEVKSNDVVLFMKGNPQFPMCGFSAQVVQILDHLGVPYKGLNVLENEELGTASRAIRTGRPSRSSTLRASSSGCDIVRECSKPANCSRREGKGPSGESQRRRKQPRALR